jgi:molecular chaperone DnaK (HSP70)
MASIDKIEAGLNHNEEGLDVEDLISEHCTKLKQAPLCTLSSLHTIGEKLKISLSGHPNEQDSVVEESCFRLPSDVENLPETADELCDAIVPVALKLSLDEYDIAAAELYERSVIPIQRLLKDLDLQKDEIDEVVMVGGTTRMPQIRELVRKELEKERLCLGIDPDLTVAYGAASVID